MLWRLVEGGVFLSLNCAYLMIQVKLFAEIFKAQPTQHHPHPYVSLQITVHWKIGHWNCLDLGESIVAPQTRWITKKNDKKLTRSARKRGIFLSLLAPGQRFQKGSLFLDDFLKFGPPLYPRQAPVQAVICLYLGFSWTGALVSALGL